MLSWKLAGTGRGRFQTAYRIRVVADGADPAGEAGPAVWDTGEVESREAIAIAYAGTALRPRTRYRWAVRIHDEDGRDSGWSEAAEFETGLLGDTDWAASWIGFGIDAELRQTPSLDQLAPHLSLERTWLPSADAVPSGSAACFRSTFTVADVAAVRHVRLIAAGADELRAWLNGQPLRLDEPVATVIADGTWKVSPVADAGWEGHEYDDDQWALAQTYGLHVIPPHGRRLPFWCRAAQPRFPGGAC